MTLNPLPDFPANGGYVLKLHRDVQPGEGRLFGRVVHIVSGEGTDFGSPDDLLAWLCRHALRGAAPADTTADTPAHEAPIPRPT